MYGILATLLNPAFSVYLHDYKCRGFQSTTKQDREANSCVVECKNSLYVPSNGDEFTSGAFRPREHETALVASETKLLMDFDWKAQD